MTQILPAPSTLPDINRQVGQLVKGRDRLTRTSCDELIVLAEQCADGVYRVARDWVDTACRFKGIESGSPSRAEDLLSGPAATLRHLRLLIQSLREISASGRPRLPGAPQVGMDGRLRVPVFPARGLYDAITFQGFKANAWMSPGVTAHSLLPPDDRMPGRWRNPRAALVLGAGNVSSIPTTDAFTKLFQEGRTVLLKMNPVNQALGPNIEDACAPLIAAGFLQIVYGGADVGAAAIAHPQIDEVHITGSNQSHDAIVWGPPGPDRDRRKRENDPVLRKPMTSELGNVTPWIIVPGTYTEAQLDFQAENVATSITNNASFNCIATKVLVTCASWPQRQAFLDKVDRVLARIPPRKAYYPGASERYARFTGRNVEPASETLPWTLIRGVSPEGSPQFFNEESFVCVCVETSLEADSETAFLERAVDFANQRLWGTLAASITLPSRFRKDSDREGRFQAALSRLDYGTIVVNHWSGIAFAMMSPAWGGVAGRPLSNAQSGIGWVHNTFMLEGIEKNVLEGPLTVSPKPMWFATHPNPEPIGWRLLELYHRPSLWKLGRLLASAVRNAR